MEKSWFNLMFSKGELEYRGELSKAMDSFAPIEKTTISKDRFIYDMDKNFYGWGERSSYYNNVDLLVNSKDIRNFISDDTFFKKFEINNDLSDLEIFFYSYCSSSYLNNRSKGDNDLHYDPYIKDTKYNCNNHINSCIDSYFRSHICINSHFLSDSNNSNESYIYNFICSESGSGKIRESKNDKIRTNSNRNNLMSSKDFDITKNYNQLWIQCDNCYGLISERIELSIDPGIGILGMKTWSLRIPLNFIRGRNLIKSVLPLLKKDRYGIRMCSSGGARMQEGSLSLMQMAKISSVYVIINQLFYISILTSPTTGGVTASFGMLGDIIIAEPYAYIAFAGKRVIEQTLKKAVPEGSQAAESLLRKGLLDAIVPRNPLKGVVSELFQLHAFFL
ncbi:LOW QUALITY PROTEIN: hypothetical protein HID58_096051 [Brassica napus]|uniref:CoA carboxyltransferase N-terminal domain-containing protein n=1 Tax=Brassica napus TaxID=3708 RepID=A0ABQ7X202_BRANA|nr:LOW QUALITY PROTEIN: hypothetical protein HID58_096051 [Brassica napus]